jgi:hypothetical protein
MGEIGEGGMGKTRWRWLRPMIYVRKIGAKTGGWTEERTVEKTDGSIGGTIDVRIGSSTDGKTGEKIDRWTGVKTVERIIDQMLVANSVDSIGQTMWRANMAEKGETMPA